MALTLKHNAAVTGLATILKEFLPASGQAHWKNHVTFGTVATSVGVGQHWQLGSKLPSVTSLLSNTFQYSRSSFSGLVTAIIQAGMVHRQKNANPITRREMDGINRYMAMLGVVIADLHDTSFLNMFMNENDSPADKTTPTKLTPDSLQRELAAIRLDLHSLTCAVDRNAAGLKLESLLNRLFKVYGLNPHSSFRVQGEQIDGSFELDNHTYLLEAKWQAQKTSEADLLIFRGKVEGKSAFTRGLFVSINGYTTDAMSAILRGKQPTFFAMNGFDIDRILDGEMRFEDYLRLRRRTLEERGEVFQEFKQLETVP